MAQEAMNEHGRTEEENNDVATVAIYYTRGSHTRSAERLERASEAFELSRDLGTYAEETFYRRDVTVGDALETAYARLGEPVEVSLENFDYSSRDLERVADHVYKRLQGPRSDSVLPYDGTETRSAKIGDLIVIDGTAVMVGRGYDFPVLGELEELVDEDDQEDGDDGDQEDDGEEEPPKVPDGGVDDRELVTDGGRDVEGWQDRAEELAETTVLKRREADVRALKERGLRHEEIAEELGIAKNTVDEYSRRINDRIGRARALVEEVDGEALAIAAELVDARLEEDKRRLRKGESEREIGYINHSLEDAEDALDRLEVLADDGGGSTGGPEIPPTSQWDHSHALEGGETLVDTDTGDELRVVEVRDDGSVTIADSETGETEYYSEREIRMGLRDGILATTDGLSSELASY